MVFYSRRLQKPVDIYGETGLEKSDKVRKKISNTGLRGQRGIFTSWCLELVTERGRGSSKIRKSPEWVRLKFGMRCRTGSKRIFSHIYQIFCPVSTKILPGLIGSLDSFWSCDTARHPVGLLSTATLPRNLL